MGGSLLDLLLKKCPHHLSPEMLALYHDANWTNYTRKPDRLAKAYEHSLAIYGAYEKRHLVGLIRVVGDGHSLVVVQDLIVLKVIIEKESALPYCNWS
ncbi:hypothetical protein ACR31S_09600 [Streptococcus iniae]